MFVERIPSLPASFGPFSPVPPARDRVFWEGIPSRVADALEAGGSRNRNFEYPPLPATLFMDYSRTGNRTRFEERYFARRRAFNASVLAECARADGRYIDDVVNGIDALCSEAAWQLPAHNSYIRDTPALALPDPSRPVLDLFACETGALLAMASYLLADALDAASPTIRARVASILRERVLAPYLNAHFWWMGNGDEPMCNWTPWCTQNVLVVAALADRESLRGLAPGAETGDAAIRAIVEKAAYGLDCFLKDYGDDGCCSEGALYYRHAGLCLFGSMEALEALAPGVFSPLYREEKIRNVALYILNVHVDGKYYVNFADCSPIAGRAGVREYLFGKRIESPALEAFAAEDWAAQDDVTLGDEINLLYRAQAVASAREIAEAAEAAIASRHRLAPGAGNAPRLPADAWYPSVGLLVACSRALCLAVKAGGNGDSHNHNDTGSFTLYKDGLPCLIDVGVESYTAKTFSSRRYEIWTMQSAWHNLPTFGEFMERDGAEYRAREVVYAPGSDRCSLSMELAGAWPAESGVASFTRSVTLDKTADAVLIEDRYAGVHAPVLSLMSALAPTVEGDSLAIGNLARVGIVGATGRIEVETVEITDERLIAAWGNRVYRTRIPFSDRLSLRIE